MRQIENQKGIASHQKDLHAHLPKGGNTESEGAIQQTEQIKFKVIVTTEDRYNDMLGAVPPIGFGGSYFLCGEPVSQRKCFMTGGIGFTYDAFFASDDYETYYTIDNPITGAEFKQLIKEVSAQQESNKRLNNVALCFVH